MTEPAEEMPQFTADNAPSNAALANLVLTLFQRFDTMQDQLVETMELCDRMAEVQKKTIDRVLEAEQSLAKIAVQITAWRGTEKFEPPQESSDVDKH